MVGFLTVAGGRRALARHKGRDPNEALSDAQHGRGTHRPPSLPSLSPRPCRSPENGVLAGGNCNLAPHDVQSRMVPPGPGSGSRPGLASCSCGAQPGLRPCSLQMLGHQLQLCCFGGRGWRPSARAGMCGQRLDLVLLPPAGKATRMPLVSQVSMAQLSWRMAGLGYDLCRLCITLCHAMQKASSRLQLSQQKVFTLCLDLQVSDIRPDTARLASRVC